MKVNFNKILKLQIRGKLAIAFAGLSILPVIIVGVLGLTINARTLKRVAIEDLNHDLLSIKAQLRSFFSSLEESIELLSSSASFQQFADAVAAGNTPAITSALKNLQPKLIRFANRKAIFYQIKFIDTRGDEHFIVERGPANEYRLMPDTELNRSGASFYLSLMRENPPETAIFLPVELIARDSQTLLPGINCIYPVDKQRLAGLLVFQIDAEGFFDIFEQKPPHSPTGKTLLVNSEGYFLYHSVNKKDWSRLLASKDILNLQTEYGESAARELLSSSVPTILQVDGEIVAHAALFGQQEGLARYILLRSISTEDLFAPTRLFTKIFAGMTGLFLLAALALAYIATRQFTEPIEKLSREVSVIAAGDYQARVNVKTYDEIEDLAQQFNIMAGSLEQRESEINQYHEQLEQSVRQRTQELRKEKDTLQAILDNVPSGFILLDQDFRIMSVSAAMEAMTGKPVKELLGRPCYEVLGNGQHCGQCPGNAAFRTGKMQVGIRQHLNPEGEKRYWEHISVPLLKGRCVEQVLEIITDVTERRRLQEQLVRSEKLAATGEMAAVIAHEIRNSLTSVRMILQLLVTNEALPASESESLDVALDSVNRMERVVKDLLRLARPGVPEKETSQINAIVKSSIEFAKHEVEKRDIKLTLRLAADLPPVNIDREQMKEAMVNLILNASQATHGAGRLDVKTRAITLKKSVRDLGQIPIVSGEARTFQVLEVTLKKGMQVIQIDFEDSGCGIASENIERIFDPFYTTKTEGTGLGLSFVKRVVSEHGGITQVTSSVGHGSCFRILLPVTANG